MEHIEMKNSSDSKLYFDTICSIGIISLSDRKINFSEVKKKTVFKSSRPKVLTKHRDEK